MQFSNPEENIKRLTLKEGAHVADFGTGSGAYAFLLARAVGDTGKVYAVDVQKDLVERLRTKAKDEGVRNIEMLWADLDELNGSKIASGALDAVVVANILFQSEHKEQFLREVRRVLKRGGELLLIDWSDSFGGMGPHREQVVTEAKAKELIGAAGLTFKEAFFAGAHHYGLLYTNP